MLENFIFIDIYWLFISLIIIGCIIYLFFRRGKNYNFTSLGDLQTVYSKNTYWYRIFYILLILVTFCFGILLSKPTVLFEKESITKEGIDMEIVFDTSYSMIAKDIKPSRIEVAKKVVGDFVSKLEGDRVGAILFAGKPFTSVPLTFDYEFITEFISEISVDTIDQDRPHLRGTAIGDAMILAANNLLKDDIDREKVIILMTDGEANTGLDPLLGLKYVKEKEIKVYTIGVGKDDETFIELIDDFGFVRRTPIGGIDEETLEKIANETGGKYYRADSKETLNQIFLDIEKLEKTEIEVDIIIGENRKYTEVLLVLLILLGGMGYLVFYRKIDI